MKVEFPNLSLLNPPVPVVPEPVVVDEIIETKVENFIPKKEEGPFKPGPGMHDTAKDYLVKVVSYGGGYSRDNPLSDGTKISFNNNKLTTSKRIDERNLSKCQMLNLKDSTVESL